MGEQVHPGQAKVFAQRLHVLDEAVTAVGGGVLGRRGPAGAALVQHDQLPVPRKAAEFAEVHRVPHRTARQADQRGSRSEHVVREVGSIVCGEDWHGGDRIMRGFKGSKQPAIPARPEGWAYDA